MVKKGMRGFTLVELIIVIVISGIIAAGSARFIAYTASGYVATATRQGNAAMGVILSQKLSRELRSALPNSVRTFNSDECIEFVPVLSADRYSVAPVAPAAAATSVTVVNTSYSLSASVTEYAAIYPSSAAAIYSPSTNTALTNAQISGITSTTLTLGASHQFPADSPMRRVYIVSDPVCYCLNTVSGIEGIFRYSGYGFGVRTGDSIPSTGNRSLLVNNVVGSSVEFEVTPATLTRNALAEFVFEVNDGGEVFHIDQEVQIRNAP
ncbi:MAG: prepilin-type N-terminal cleavage/methylation domain-containing protein [Pseudomonadales bacterium]|nr:prepilin-type N-terminal cleavage/methylation domain-containing protein [Pseudomonadales bacterium]